MNTPGVHYPHRIRLRGPWQSEPAAGAVRRVRRFGYPGRIDADERVWLTVAGVGGRVEVSLNGELLASHEGGAPFEHDITSHLGPRNEVVLCVEPGHEAGGDVALEVRKTAFLRGVHATADAGAVCVRGDVVGSAGRPLEVYVLLDGRTVHYGMVEPSTEGRLFEAVAEGRGELVRVELVDGASVWYAVEVRLPG
jgi:hypothetical protein